MGKKPSEHRPTVRRMIDLLWEDRSGHSWPVRWLVSELRILYFVLRGLKEHQCTLRASALTFVTLLSIVPVLALGFATVKGLGLKSVLQPVPPPAAPTASDLSTTPVIVGLAPAGAGAAATTAPVVQAGVVHAPPPMPPPTSAKRGFGELARDALTRQLTADQAEVWNRIVSYVERTDFATLKALGIILLILTVITALGTMEDVFNEIWGIRRSRTLLRKFADYLSVIIICPVLMTSAMAMTTALSSNSLLERLRENGLLREAMPHLFGLAPWLSIWAALTFLYLFLPNTRVKVRSALLGGLVAGVIWHLAFMGYTRFQTGVSRYNAIYSTLAALPFFLTWLYASWLIVLFGAEIAAARQNIEIYARERMTRKISPTERLQIGLNLTLAVCARFRREETPWTADQLGRYLECPVRLIEDILDDLVEKKIVVPSGNGQPPTYQPAVPLANISPARVVESLQESDASGVVGNATPESMLARTLMGQWGEGLWRELGTVGFDTLLEEMERGSTPALLPPSPDKSS